MKGKAPDIAALKKDIFTTLAICALLNDDDNRAVQSCAKKLIKRAPRALAKNTLYPMADSLYAYTIVMDEVTFPEETRVIGTARREGYEYEIILKWREFIDFDYHQVVDLVAMEFIKRGFIDGRVYMSFVHPFIRRNYDTSAYLPDYARYSAAEQDAA
jgi:hypothetical protein